VLEGLICPTNAAPLLIFPLFSDRIRLSLP